MLGVHEPIISSSKNQAQFVVSGLDGNYSQTFLDVPHPHTTKSECGKPVKAEIKETRDHYIGFQLASLKEEMKEV